MRVVSQRVIEEAAAEHLLGCDVSDELFFAQALFDVECSFGSDQELPSDEVLEYYLEDLQEDAGIYCPRCPGN